MLIIILASVIGGMCGGLALGVVLWSIRRRAQNYEWVSERMH